MRLTDVSIRSLPSPPAGAKIYHCDILKGFGVRVSRGGVRAFTLTYGDARERVTIGRYPIISLAEARTEAKRILAERTLGKRQNPRVTFLVALETFLSTHVAEKNREGTAKEMTRILRKQLTPLHKKQLADITTHDIMHITDKMLTDGRPSAANHAFMAARTFLRWCVRRRYIPRSPLEGLERPAEAKSRERTLTDDEVRTVWHAAELSGIYGRIAQLLLLTGQRRGEIGALRAEYIVGDTICLPSHLTKNGRSHTFPIGALAQSILGSRRQAVGFLFPARGATEAAFDGWSKSKPRLDKRIAIARGSEEEPNPLPPWTLHDLRRTFATGLQRLGVRIEVIEALLNHVSGTRAGIVGVYQRHNYAAEMRDAVERWGTHLGTILETRKDEAT